MTISHLHFQLTFNIFVILPTNITEWSKITQYFPAGCQPYPVCTAFRSARKAFLGAVCWPLGPQQVLLTFFTFCGCSHALLTRSSTATVSFTKDERISDSMINSCQWRLVAYNRLCSECTRILPDTFQGGGLWKCEASTHLQSSPKSYWKGTKQPSGKLERL